MAPRQTQPATTNEKGKKSFCISKKITSEEEKFRSSHFPDEASIPASKLSCTKCNVVIKPRTVTVRNVHPVLEVLLCLDCRTFYDRRQPHIQNLCAWCTDGGTLFGCSSCSAKFCGNCITKHFRLARIIFQEVDKRKWNCPICFSKPIWSQRADCAAAIKYADYADKTLKERIARLNTARRVEPAPTQTTSTGSGTLPSVIGFTTTSSACVSKPKEKFKFFDMDDPICGANKEKKVTEQHKKDESNLHCVICLLNPRIMGFYPCGHKCLCFTCSVVFPVQDRRCPLCRREYKDIIRFYD